MSSDPARSYFARWIRMNGQESAIHWFTDGTPACGATVRSENPPILPPDPELSCRHCINSIRRRDTHDEAR